MNLVNPSFSQTDGCGACFEQPYCIPELNAADEWIAMVRIDTFENLTQGTAKGYGNFSGAIDPIIVEQGSSFELTLAPGYPGANSFDEYFTVWADWDHNGSFSSNEIIYSSAEGTKTMIGTTIAIPESSELGITRLRIGMRNFPDDNPCPFGGNRFGEIEDYCIDIRETTSTSIGVVENQNTFNVFPNPVMTDEVTVETKFSTSIRQMYIDWINADGATLKSVEINNHPAGVTQKEQISTVAFPAGVYFVRLRSNGKKTLIRKLVLVK